MLGSAYLIYATFMVFAHPQFIYPFGPDTFEAPEFRREVVSDRDVTLAVHDADGDVAVLFFMGNGGSLAYFTLRWMPIRVRTGLLWQWNILEALAFRVNHLKYA